MEGEIDSIDENKIWTLDPLPNDRRDIGSKCIYKIKRDGTSNA